MGAVTLTGSRGKPGISGEGTEQGQFLEGRPDRRASRSHRYRCHNGLVTGDFRERLSEGQFLSWEEKAGAGSRSCLSSLLTLKTETGLAVCFLGGHSKREDQRRTGSRRGKPKLSTWSLLCLSTQSCCLGLSPVHSLSAEGGWQLVGTSR